MWLTRERTAQEMMIRAEVGGGAGPPADAERGSVGCILSNMAGYGTKGPSSSLPVNRER